MKKIIALLLAVIMLTACFAGCTGKDAGKSADGKTKLKWIISGQGELKDCQKVWAEFNKELQKYMPGTTVEFEVISYSDFAEKWNLISASREEVDLVWVGWMLDLNEEVRKGSFRELDSLMQYAPDLTKEIPESVIDLDRVGGKLYAIPNYQMITSLPYGAYVPTDLMEEYDLDVEAIQKNLSNNENITREDFKPFEDYLEKLKKDGKLGKGVGKNFLDYIAGAMKGVSPRKEQVVANAYIKWQDDDLKVYNFLDYLDKDMEYFDMVTDWFNKGYIRKDILSLQDTTLDQGKKDGYVLWADSCFMGASETATKKYGMDITVIPIYEKLWIPHTRPTTNTAISKTSKNPEKAMELLDLINTKKGKDLYNMLVFGLEGEHYKKISDTEIEWLLDAAPGSSSENAYGYSAWAMGNTFNAYTTQFDTPGWNEYILNEVNAKATPSPLIGFSPDISPIKLEIAQYNAIFKEYLYLDLGATENYKELLKERNEKLRKAGGDKIVKEIQKQINEWKKTK